MKLQNRVNVRSTAAPLIVSQTFLASLLAGILVLSYLNFRGSLSFATDYSTTSDRKTHITGDDFRVLQNGQPITPLMGVAINSQAVFEVQVKLGVDLKKEKNKPIGAEVALLRGDKKVSSLKFNDVKQLKLKDLNPWINSNFQAGDKISIELLNTVLEPGESVKIYSLANVY